jgi:LacI family transcriptional regulator
MAMAGGSFYEGPQPRRLAACALPGASSSKLSNTMKKPTMSDIAARVGISQASVSLVLSNAPGTRISRATRDRVLTAAQELGYDKPDRTAATNGVIGLIINELATSQHATTLIEAAREEAAENGCLLSIFSSQGKPQTEAAILDHLTARPLVGIIYTALLTRGVQPPDRLLEVPAVLLNCHAAKDLYPSIVPADIAGGFAATAALLDAGHRRIAMINGEDWIEAARDRLQGYRQALATYDVAVDPRLILSGGWTLSSGREQTRRLLDLPDPPTAIFCFCDRMAVGAYEAVRARGLSVPQDVSLVGFDDETFAAEMMPPLTTIKLPHEAMARWAVTRLLDLAENPNGERKFRKLKMECGLVTRSSIAARSGPPGSAVLPTRPGRSQDIAASDGSRDGTALDTP